MIDNNNNFYNKLILFWSKVKKQGFTLAEALIVTVMTGYCLLPILGTMQNAQSRTQEYDHQSKMQLYSRSRLTEEIANAAFDHTSVNTDPEYHYIVYLDKGESGRNGDEKNAQLIELPKTSITPEQLKTLEKTTTADWDTEAMDFVGIKKSDPKGYINILNIYQTSVETSNTPPLEYDGNTSTDKETPKALLGIVVKTCLLQSPEGKYDEKTGMLDGSDESVQIPPFTLFSFVNLPVVSDEMIWLADAANYLIYGVDPISRGITKIELPKKGPSDTGPEAKEECRPWFIAVHPSLKILACASKKYLYLINIDKKSNDFKKVSPPYSYTDHIHEEGGMSFRPDGKYLFVCPDHSSGEFKLDTYEITYNIDPITNKLIWNPEDATSPEPKLTLKNPKGSLVNIDEANKIVGFFPANDGYLYVAYNNKNIGVTRYPMYCNDIDDDKSSWASETIISYRAQGDDEEDDDYANDTNNLTSNITSIDVSPDGTKLALIADADIYIYDTRNKEKITSANIKKEDLDTGEIVFEPNKVTFTALSNSTQDKIYDDKNLILTVTNKIPEQSAIAYVTYYDSNDKTLKKLRGTYYSDNKGGNFAITTPDNLSVVISDQQKSQIYFGTVEKNDSTDVISEANGNFTLISDTTDDIKNTKDLDTSKRDILAVASDKTIKQYNINTFKEIEDENFTATWTITSLSMNPQGNMLLAGFGNINSDNKGTGSTGFSMFHLNDLSSNEKKGSAFGKKSVFDDRTPNMAFSLEYPTDTGENQNAFWNIDTPYSETPLPLDDPNWKGADSSYERRDFDLHSDWKRLDLIGMPKGGALALYGKDDDGSSMLEWIGRRNWDQDPDKIGKYKLFARWTSGGNYYDKTIPEGTSDFSGASLDGWYGRIHIFKEQLFPVNSIIKSFNAVIGNWDSSEDRWVTFLILEKNGSGEFKVIDYSESFSFKSGTGGVTDKKINWLNGGIIKNKNCRVGFYNGGSGDSSANGTRGAFIYKVFTDADNIYNYFRADYNISSKVSSSAPEDGIPYSTVTNRTETFYETSFGDRERNYSLNFKASIPDYSKSFPPTFSKKLAISPDSGTLAILSKNTISSIAEEKVPILSLYDFNNFNFEQETQIEGMLADYRVKKDAENNNINWPAESNDRVFEKVADNCNFINSSNAIPSLASATTKNDSWSSFNNNPCNYKVYSESTSLNSESLINKVKGYANKRFFGYFRPENNINMLSLHFTDEPRVFLNSSLLYGSEETNLNTDSLISYPFKGYTSGLFQLDHASNGAGMNLSVFFNTNSGATFTDIEGDCPSITTGNPNEQYFCINDTNKEIGWTGFVSSYTYILNNHPTFISTYKVQNTSISIDMDYADMIFSRDKAKPVLYIKGKKYLFVLYKNKLFRVENDYVGDNSKNLVISSDGQKLIYSNGSEIKAFNIATPIESLFEESSPDYKEKDTDPKHYLGEYKTITLDSNPSFLATKPFVSYKSSKIGGYYNTLCSDSTFKISTNNSVAVASGGIYLIGSSSTDIGLYNPITSPESLNTTLFENELKKETCYSAVSAYDDTIYLFGNDINSDNFLSGRVQSFNPNTGVSMCSLDEKVVTGGDQFWINPCAIEYSESYINAGDGYNNGWRNAIEVSPNGDDTSSGNPEYAFDADNNWGWNSKNSTNDHFLLYSVKDGCYPEFAVNKIEINNSKVPHGNKGVTDAKRGVNSFEFFGIGDDGIPVSLGSGNVPKNSTSFECPLTNINTKYKSYKFHLKTSNHHNENKNIGVTEVKMYRTGVKRLTPKGKPNSVDLTNHSAVFNTADGNINVWWSNHKVETKTWTTGVWPFQQTHSATYHYPLSDIFSNNITLKIDDNTKIWKCNSSERWVMFEFPDTEKVSIIRYCNSKKNLKLVSFKLYGSNNCSISIPSDCNDVNTSVWNFVFQNSITPDIDTSFITFEFENPNEYKYYLLDIESVANGSNYELAGLELYAGTGTGESLSTESPTENYLTSMKNDNLENIRCDNSAACATPYGLVVTGGFDTLNDAIPTSLLYWPHAINRYDGNNYQYGIPRSLPNMKVARANHALVWHKGKIYAIGGRKDTSNNNITGAFIEVLDYNKKMEWEVYSKPYKYVDGASDDAIDQRFNHGACSFGDEIFIFGGADKSHTRTSATAFNPETGVMRHLTDMGSRNKLNPCAAVPFGSKIYIFGNDEDNPDLLKILEYTP